MSKSTCLSTSTSETYYPTLSVSTVEALTVTLKPPLKLPPLFDGNWPKLPHCRLIWPFHISNAPYLVFLATCDTCSLIEWRDVCIKLRSLRISLSKRWLAGAGGGSTDQTSSAVTRVCRDGVEPKGKTLSLMVCLRSTPYLHSWDVDPDWKNEIQNKAAEAEKVDQVSGALEIRGVLSFSGGLGTELPLLYIKRSKLRWHLIRLFVRRHLLEIFNAGHSERKPWTHWVLCVSALD